MSGAQGANDQVRGDHERRDGAGEGTSVSEAGGANHDGRGDRAGERAAENGSPRSAPPPRSGRAGVVSGLDQGDRAAGPGVVGGFVPVLRAEWTKARTVRSTWWSLATTVILSFGLAVLLGFQMANLPPERRSDIDLAQLSFLSLLMGQIALVVFGVLLVSAEYTTGTIRASLAAVPRRGVFLAAKALVAAGVAGVTAVVVGFGTFLATQWAMGGEGVTLDQPGVLRAVFGSCAYLTMMCVFAMGVATVLRSSALALGILLPLLFLNSQGLASLPAIRSVTQYLPDQAGAGMMRIAPDEVFFLGELDFGPGVAFLIMLAWVAASLVGGYVSLRSRDA